jgi:formate-dependent nitrite reductase membrane component NrfD
MAVLLLTPAGGTPMAVFNTLAKAILVLLVIKAVVVTFYIQASHRTDESRSSAHLLLKARLSGMFRFGLMVIGLLLPLALVIINLTAVPTGNLWLLRAAAVLGLVGGFILRRLVLAAGVRTPLRAAGVEYTFPSPIH